MNGIIDIINGLKWINNNIIDYNGNNNNITLMGSTHICSLIVCDMAKQLQ